MPLHPEYVSGTVLIDAFVGDLLKELVQKLGMQVDSSIVQSAKQQINHKILRN